MVARCWWPIWNDTFFRNKKVYIILLVLIIFIFVDEANSFLLLQSIVFVKSDNTDHYHITIEMKHSELSTSLSTGVYFAQHENQGSHEMNRFALKSKRMNRQRLINVINAALDLIEDFDETPSHASKDCGRDNSR